MKYVISLPKVHGAKSIDNVPQLKAMKCHEQSRSLMKFDRFLDDSIMFHSGWCQGGHGDGAQARSLESSTRPAQTRWVAALQALLARPSTP